MYSKGHDKYIRKSIKAIFNETKLGVLPTPLGPQITMGFSLLLLEFPVIDRQDVRWITGTEFVDPK